jgi:hypothetical protein
MIIKISRAFFGRLPGAGAEIEIFDINGRIVYKNPVGDGLVPYG